MATCKNCNATITKTNLRINRLTKPIKSHCQKCIMKNGHWLEGLDDNTSYNIVTK